MVGQFALFAVLALVAGAHALPPQRIMGGEYAVHGEFPYQVSLRYNGRHFCGGSIIGDRHILTAAHCFEDGPSIDKIIVVSGSLWSRFGGEIHTPLYIGLHAGFSKVELVEDIALIYLASPIQFSDVQNKIKLPSAPTPNHVMATVSGWGEHDATTKQASDLLKKLRMRTFTAKDCQRLWPNWGVKLDDRQICSFSAGGHSPCNGDSGGPLAYNGELIGIVSKGEPCPTSMPEIFTNVYHYLDWIANATDHLANKRDGPSIISL